MAAPPLPTGPVPRPSASELGIAVAEHMAECEDTSRCGLCDELWADYDLAVVIEAVG